MASFIEFLGTGRLDKENTISHFIVESFTHITKIIIPFFRKYPIQGVKVKDFYDLCKVAEIMKEKGHLSAEGLDKIHKIKAAGIGE